MRFSVLTMLERAKYWYQALSFSKLLWIPCRCSRMLAFSVSYYKTCNMMLFFFIYPGDSSICVIFAMKTKLIVGPLSMLSLHDFCTGRLFVVAFFVYILLCMFDCYLNDSQYCIENVFSGDYVVLIELIYNGMLFAWCNIYQ